MDYQLKKLTNEQILQLPKVSVPNNDAIASRFGEPMSVAANYELVRDVTNNFETPLDKFQGENRENLEGLDFYTYQFLSIVGFFENSKKGTPTATTEKPESKPKPTKIGTEQRIKKLQLAGKYLKGEKLGVAQKRIKKLQLALKYLKN
jgi:hypothetical protein